MTEIIVAIITGAVTLIGVLASNNASKKVIEVRMDELTREVREHNGFAKKMPVLEEKIRVVNHRIDDLEEKTK